jgi:hypothetical protein
MYVIDPGFVHIKDTSSPVVAGSGGYANAEDDIKRAANIFINLNENIIIKSAIIVLPIISCFSVNKYNNL